MNNTEFEIKTYSRQNIPYKEVAALLSDVLFEDGMSTYLFPNPKKRKILLPKLMRTYINVALKQGSIEILQDVSTNKKIGIATWFGPEDPYLHTKDFLLNLLHPSRIRIFFHWLPRLTKILEFGDLGEEIHKRIKGKHFYLALMGLLPEYRRKNLGGILLSSKLKESEIKKIGVYLESCNPENLSFYKRFGLSMLNQVAGQEHPILSSFGLNVELQKV